MYMSFQDLRFLQLRRSRCWIRPSETDHILNIYISTLNLCQKYIHRCKRPRNVHILKLIRKQKNRTLQKSVELVEISGSQTSSASSVQIPRLAKLPMTACKVDTFSCLCERLCDRTSHLLIPRFVERILCRSEQVGVSQRRRDRR